ncbi:heme peroxidase [Phialemonium atrogriseum]|uniref:Heme peroxidase n=1 Tax=Phialemonium atrogriseum TaxID=1093897 RepID=A0AAJ0BWT8_9PEZI|nr:heme peroxidase [Phialemonium atrogriseum]KAK1765407.1 heme peroxidase [Phialemonium atrogriseum]
MAVSAKCSEVISEKTATPFPMFPQFGQDLDSETTEKVAEWFSNLVGKSHTGQLCDALREGEVPGNVNSVQEPFKRVRVPGSAAPVARGPIPDVQGQSTTSNAPDSEANDLFSYLGFPLDPRCMSDRNKWWYRTYDGSCNWIKANEINEGQTGTGKSRDHNQHAYADGISKPRDGPNPRAVSNAFFKRHKTLYYEHTPFLLGLVEFIIHDVTWSQDSTTEFIDVPMPPDETEFPLNTTLRVWRAAAVPGTGTSKENPRENLNMATAWMDVSVLYGSTEEVAKRLRSFKGGKLLEQMLTTRGAKVPRAYLPFNTMGVPTRTRPGVDPTKLFAGGDPRTNEDWIMLAVHTLFLREHNRLCDILAGQHPEYDDERLYQTVRLIVSAKFQLIGNVYQMAYWADDMPWPTDDGFPLFRAIHGEGFLDINPANTYPWPLVTKNGKPTTISAEMAVVYRFHDFIIPDFPIKDAQNETLWDQNLFATGFNAQGFIDAGLENILRGILATSIPNFHSGVDDGFRTAGKYRGVPFDLATWSIVHEREQGLPTFNKYFEAYNAQGKQSPTLNTVPPLLITHPGTNVTVPIRKRFEDFSSDPTTVASLSRLYATPDDVDLVVGVQLDEERFPGTTIPKSAAIISLFSLFGTGNSDRFSVGFAMMRCWLVDKPWDCRPSNALEDLLWKPLLPPTTTTTTTTTTTAGPDLPNLRFYDPFWLREIDVQAHGANLLWRLITENTDIDCLQRRPLFPADPDKNPVVCSLDEGGGGDGLVVGGGGRGGGWWYG